MAVPPSSSSTAPASIWVDIYLPSHHRPKYIVTDTSVSLAADYSDWSSILIVDCTCIHLSRYPPIICYLMPLCTIIDTSVSLATHYHGRSSILIVDCFFLNLSRYLPTKSPPAEINSHWYIRQLGGSLQWLILYLHSRLHLHPSK